MKSLTLCVCSTVLALTALAQQPPPPPAPGSSPTATATASVSVSPGSLADKIHQKIDKKLKGHHGIVIDGNDSDLGNIKSEDLPEFVIPIVAITMLTIFGAPVLIVNGTEDSYTSIEDARALFTAASDPKELWAVQGAGHVSLYAFAKAQYEQHVGDFLDRYLHAHH